MSNSNNQFDSDNGNNYPEQQNPYLAEPEMSVKDWLLTLLVLAIPCVNIVMMIVWAFSDKNKTKSNFCKAYLILMVIIFVVGIISSVLLGSTLAVLLSSMY